MRRFRGFDALPSFVRPAVTVGSFDGVHLGHQALVRTLVQKARACGGESIVVTFDPHPRIALGRAEGMRLLTTTDEKAVLLESMGVDNLVVIPFDSTFAGLSGAEFIERYLIGRLGAETLIAGYNHRFGHDRIDCASIPPECGLRIVRIGAQEVDGVRVSSTVIRRLLDAGRTEEAARMLGREEQGSEERPSADNYKNNEHDKPRL